MLTVAHTNTLALANALSLSLSHTHTHTHTHTLTHTHTHTHAHTLTHTHTHTHTHSHTRRLERLEDLASIVLSSVTATSATLERLEETVAEFEVSCTSLSPDRAEERAAAIRGSLQVGLYVCIMCADLVSV